MHLGFRVDEGSKLLSQHRKCCDIELGGFLPLGGPLRAVAVRAQPGVFHGRGGCENMRLVHSGRGRGGECCQEEPGRCRCFPAGEKAEEAEGQLSCLVKVVRGFRMLGVL